MNLKGHISSSGITSKLLSIAADVAQLGSADS